MPRLNVDQNQLTPLKADGKQVGNRHTCARLAKVVQILIDFPLRTRQDALFTHTTAARILDGGDPLEIAQAVVIPTSIEVVHGILLIWVVARHTLCRNQTMQFFCLPPDIEDSILTKTLVDVRMKVRLGVVKA
eukprot:CAMPEP_0170138180 /NCGR_PEP_ID=MMETSP0033_2-20121228/4731_1 /TAXON_ID=195969 /ORGANISM="Dolichomastix tenuilepis, Strain CCMP3274" /LENGTH=132 /DNA_ID=CAMNT_0010374161 /DNA_START=632 /DNA_END=1027 /DNA_ORIENTATION=-